MSGKGGNPKPEKAQGEQKKQEQRKPWQKKHHYQCPEVKKKDPEEIPILKYALTTTSQSSSGHYRKLPKRTMATWES